MSFASDVRYTLKQLPRNAGFNLLCAALIALGLTMAMALFSLTWNFRYKSPDIAQAQRWSVLTLATPQNPNGVTNFFPAQWYEFARENIDSFSVFGASRNRVGMNLNDGEESRVAIASLVEPSLLEAAGIQPLTGRLLQPADDQPGAGRVVLLGHDLWRNHFAGDPGIVGRSVDIGGLAHTVVGVMPPGYGFPLNAELWLPLRLDEGIEPQPGQPNLTLLGVLREGVSLAQANAEIQGIGQAFNAEYADEMAQPLLTFARPFNQLMGLPPVLALVLQALTLAILLLVAFNLGNLLLYRANERSHELAVRGALGASPWRIIRVLLLESLVICALGSLLGLLLAAFALDYIGRALRVALGGDPLPFWMHFGLDGAFIGFALAATIGLWLLSGLPPARRLHAREPGALLAAGSRGLASKGSLRLTRVFVNLEVIVSSFLLMICAAIVVVTALDVRRDFGVDSRQRYAATVRINDGVLEPERVSALAEELRREQELTPGVSAASYSTGLPSHEARLRPFGLEDRSLESEGIFPELNVVAIADNYFEFLAVPLLAGRVFAPGDDAGAPPVAIIDERLAALLWPGESALGKRLQLDPERDGPWLDIVGVVATVFQEYSPLEGRPSRHTLYRPFSQGQATQFTSVIHSTLPRTGAFDLLRATSARVSPDIAVFRLNTLQDFMMINSRPYLLLRDIFISVTVLLALLIGSVIYGLISRSYMNRAGEIGLRRALGASDRQAVRVFLRETAWTLLLGLGIGGLGGLLLSGALGGLFPNMGRYLPAVAVLSLGFIAAVILLAAYVPARRAVAMEPGDALRHD